MTPPKPSAKDIKKQVAQLLNQIPEEAGLDRILIALANHDAVVRMLGQTFPASTEGDLRRTLADTAALLQSLKAWAAPAPRGASKKASAPVKDAGAGLSRAVKSRYSDPTVLAGYDKVKFHVDGACKGNPGPSSAGVVITDVEGAVLYEDGKYLGIMTNNAAEYQALIHALGILVDNGCPEAYCFADSLLMVNQMNLTWRVKHPGIKPLFTRAQQLKRKLPRFQIVHVKRDKNKRADKLANLAIKQARDASLL